MAPNFISKISRPTPDGTTPTPDFDISKSYFNDPEFSSRTIRFGDKTIYVHDIILCRRSEYFRKLILGPFKVCYILSQSCQHCCPLNANLQIW